MSLRILASYYRAFSFYFRYDTFTWLDKTLFDPIDWHYFLDVNKASPYFTPMGNVLFFALHRLFGLKPAWYHACMLAIHTLNAFLVYRLALRILGGKLQAYLAALLFAIFPAHVDAVVYVATIHHTLATTFILLSLSSFVQFLQTGQRRHFSIMLVFCVLGLLTKQIACVIPALCAGYEYLALRNRVSRSSLARYVPMALVVAIYLVVNAAVNRANTVYAPIHATYYRVDAHILGSLAAYVGFLVFPVDNLVHAVATRFLLPLQTWFPYLRALLAVVFVALAACYAVKLREVRFSLLWVLVALLPSLPFLFPPQSRYVYLASVGFSLLLASMATARGAPSKPLRGVIVAVLVAYSFINLASMHSFARDYSSWRQWLSEIQSFYPALPPDSDLYLVDFPRLAISRDDEINSAVRVTLNNPTLRVHAVSREEYSWLETSDAFYALQYDESGHFTDAVTQRPLTEQSPSPAGALSAADKWALWSEGINLRGANIYQRRVYPELDGLEFMGPGPVGPPYTQADFDRLAAMGANYVNISHPGLFSERPPYTLDEGIQANLDHLLAMIAQADLYAVISFRTGPGRSEFTFFWDEVGTWFDETYLNDSMWQDQAAQDAWVQMWAQTAERYRHSPIVAGYDLMVEPNSNEVGSHALYDPLDIWDPEEFYAQYGGTLYDWNQLYPRITTGIRQVDGSTPILIGGMAYSAVEWLPYLQPTSDARTVYVVHQYAPHLYTHQEPFTSDCTYPGYCDLDWDGNYDDWLDRIWLEELLSTVDDFATTHGMPAAVNEFGVMRWVPGAAEFLDDEMDLFEQHGWNHALWVWEPAWAPWAEEVDAFNFRHGSDPQNHSDVPSAELMDTIRSYWSHNTIRPSSAVTTTCYLPAISTATRVDRTAGAQ